MSKSHKIQTEQGDASQHYVLGNALLAQRKIAEAIGHYERVLAIKTDHAGAHGNLGAALAAQGRTAEAIPHLERALAADPNQAAVQNNLGAALKKQGRIAESIVRFERALAIDKDHNANPRIWSGSCGDRDSAPLEPRR